MITQSKISILFDGDAEKAMHFYTTAFSNSSILSTITYPAAATLNNKVKSATLKIGSQEVLLSDCLPAQPITATTAISIFLAFDSENELKNTFTILAKNGTELVPIGPTDTYKIYGWVQDKFGVSWQLYFKPRANKEGNLCFANNSEVRPEYRDDEL